MTGVEIYSTTRSGRRSRWPRCAGVVGSVVVTAIAASALPFVGPVGADPLATAKAQAAALAQQIQAQGQRLAALSEQYDQAQLRVQQLDAQLSATRAAVAQTQAQVGAAQADLRRQALDAYMSGGAGTGLEQVFTSGGEQSTAAQEYRAVAGGNVSGAIDHLNQVQATLAQEQSQLQATEQSARDALGQADAAKRGSAAALAGQQATLSHVKGQIATLVAQQQAAQAAAQAAAFQAQLAAERARQASLKNTSVGLVPAPPAAGGAGGKAVSAAESQIGVPYVYGGATPGVGFDCSGLTMWAWEQAGVSLSHSAAAQYGETTHIPLSDLQPGDLLFYYEGGTIGHVTMYVGPGEMIQAEETGTRIQITGIWSTGLVGAGRP